MIDQATVDRIFSTAQIQEVVSDFVSLKKRGVNYIGNCPFHNEKTPSFIVSPAKGICKCFGCGKGGNAVNFIMEIEQVNYYEALKYLAKKYNIEIVEKEATPEEKQKQSDRDSMLIVSTFAQEYFSKVLKGTQEGQAVGLSYFRERGFRDDIIEKFQLGYCRDLRDGFTKAALEKGYKLEYLEKTGLTIVRDDYQADRFKGRVMFPIHSVAGKVIGFGGRILADNKKTAKYLNSPESEIYSKSRILYGMFHAKRSIVQEDRCILVEGYTDVLSMHQSGIENVVASSGTSLTVDQIKLIKRFTKNITILYDGDQAGIKASFRGINMVLEEGLNVKVLSLPEGEDPDSFAKSKSASELVAYIAENQTDFIRFKTEILLAHAGDDPIKRAELINDIVETIKVIPDNVVQSVYVRECSSLLDIGEDVIYSALGKKSRSVQKNGGRNVVAKPRPPQIHPAQTVTKDSLEYHERDIARLLILYGKKELSRSIMDGQEIVVSVADFIRLEIIDGEMGVTTELYASVLEKYFGYDADWSQEDLERAFVNSPEKVISDFVVTILSSEENTYLHKIWTKGDNYVSQEADLLHEIVPWVINSYKERRISAEIQEVMLKLKDNPPEEQGNVFLARLQQLNEYKTMLAKSLNNRGVI